MREGLRYYQSMLGSGKVGWTVGKAVGPFTGMWLDSDEILRRSTGWSALAAFVSYASPTIHSWFGERHGGYYEAATLIQTTI